MFHSAIQSLLTTSLQATLETTSELIEAHNASFFADFSVAEGISQALEVLQRALNLLQVGCSKLVNPVEPFSNFGVVPYAIGRKLCQQSR